MTAQFFPGVTEEIAVGVANHLWQSTVVALIVALLTLVLKKNHARIRYWLWFAASLKFFIPFSLLVMLGGHLTWLHRVPPSQATDANAGAYLVMEQVGQPFTPASIPSTPATADMKTAPAVEQNESRAEAFLPATIAAIWLLGTLFISARWTRRWWRISVIAQVTPTLCEGREADALRRMTHLGRFRRSVELKMLPIPVEPGIFGLFRPVLLWPQEISERLDDAQLEAVLAHEVCHARRGDNITAAIHMTVQAIFWFHPLVWWLEARLVKERESACDEAVLQMCGQARAYAESILKVCEFCVETPLTCVSGVAGADLRRRIADITRGRVLLPITWPKRLLIAATSVCVVAAPVVVGQAKAAQRLISAVAKIAPKPAEAAAAATLPVERKTTASADSELAAMDSSQATAPQPQPQPTPAVAAQAPARPQGKLVGNWQGTLQQDGGNGLRALVKISEDDAKYYGQFYSIDQGGQPIALSSVSLHGASVTFTIKALDLMYKGTLNPDGNTISGDMTQHGGVHPFSFDHVSPENAWAIPEALKAMAADADPAYDVAAIKPSDPSGSGRHWGAQGRHVIMMDATIAGVMQISFGLHAKQIIGAPDWIFTDAFDIDGVPNAEGRPSQDQMKGMFRKLLASRFHLSYHVEERELPVYALRLAKDGPKVTVTAQGQEERSGFGVRPGVLMVTNQTMAEFANDLQRSVMDKPVVDQTGLKEHYDFSLNWTPDESQFIPLGLKITPLAADVPNALPSLYTALEEQLGLKLEATKATTEVIVVDHIEKPGAN